MPFARTRSIHIVLAGALVLAGCEAAGDADREGASESAQSTSRGKGSECEATDGPPSELRCTGLYSDWESRTIDPSALAYAPGFQLWSDGAQKSRWVILPPGTKIDVRDMNGWVFPVGTKFFKEFRLEIAGQVHRVETRMLWKRDTGWESTKYIWSPTEESATRVTASVKPLPELTDYEAPADASCALCHRGARDKALGFGAVLLAAPEATGATYAHLVKAGLLDGDAPDVSHLQIPGDSIARDAMGRLHVGCGVTCHNASGIRQLQMRIDVTGGQTPTRVEDTLVFKTGVNKPSEYGLYRIAPGDETKSAVFRRMDIRGSGQMPPVATRLRDEVSLDVVRRWIRGMAPPSPSTP
jgi:hypothetical protein